MNKTIGAVLSALVIIFCIVISLFCTVRIPAGYVGVIYNMNGGVAETTLSQGFHLVKPTQKSYYLHHRHRTVLPHLRFGR